MTFIFFHLLKSPIFEYMGNTGKKKKQRFITAVTTDVIYIAATIVIERGVSFMSVTFNALLLFLLYYIFLYIYRYAFMYKIGAGSRPVLEQMGFKVSRKTKNIMRIVFALPVVLFPVILLGTCISAVKDVIVLDTDLHPFRPMIIGFSIIYAMILNPIVFYLNSLPHEKSMNNQSLLNFYMGKYLFPKPGPKMKSFLVAILFPILAVAAAASISSINGWIDSMTQIPFELFFISVISFLPFRYMILRIEGASWISLISFLITVIISSFIFLI